MLLLLCSLVISVLLSTHQNFSVVNYSLSNSVKNTFKFRKFQDAVTGIIQNFSPDLDIVISSLIGQLVSLPKVDNNSVDYKRL